LYLFISTVLNPNVVTIEAYHIYQLHKKNYPPYFSQVNSLCRGDY